VTASPDSTKAAAVFRGGSVRLWEITPAGAAVRAERAVGRTLTEEERRAADVPARRPTPAPGAR
jgi:hypothetical protein